MIRRFLVTLIALLTLAYLVLPLVVILGSSVTTTPFLSFPPQGASLKWYAIMLHEPGYVSAYATSTLLATCATALAMLLAVPAAIALARYEYSGKRAVHALLSAPMVLPHIVLAAALLQFGGSFGLVRNFSSLLVGHVVIVIPFILQSVMPLFTSGQLALEEASADLGATRLETFFLVTLPQIRPGLVAGAVIAFITSWINVEMSIFNTTAELNTIPVKLFNYVQYTIDPTIAAVSGATIVAAAIAILVLDLSIGLGMLDQTP
jgi:putative spermidine/putrescine transport system permease protein